MFSLCLRFLLLGVLRLIDGHQIVRRATALGDDDDDDDVVGFEAASCVSCDGVVVCAEGDDAAGDDVISAAADLYFGTRADAARFASASAALFANRNRAPAK